MRLRVAFVAALVAVSVFAAAAVAAPDADYTPGELAANAAASEATSKGAVAVTVAPDGKITALMPPGKAAEFSSSRIKAKAAAMTKAEYDTVMASLESVAGKGDGWYIDANTGKVNVNTDNPGRFSDAIANYPGVVAVTGPAKLPRAGKRSDDATPHYGGSSVFNSAYICTSGPVVQNGAGARYQVAAGHCSPPELGNTSWFRTDYPGLFYATTLTTLYPTYRDTALLYNTTFGNRIWNGNSTTTQSLHQSGAGDPAIGLVYYASTRSGTKWGFRILSVNYTLCYTYCFTNMALAQEQSDHIVSGDSGAPVHTKSGSNAGIRGIVNASGGGEAVFEKWSFISAYLGVVIVT